MKIKDKADQLVSRALAAMEKDLESPDTFTRSSAIDQIILALLYQTKESDYVEQHDTWAEFFEQKSEEAQELSEHQKENL